MTETSVTLPDGTVLTGEAAMEWVKGRVSVDKSLARSAEQLVNRGTSLGGPGNFSEMRAQAMQLIEKIKR